MREVAVQAANDTNNGQDRDNLAAEMTAMVSEIDRISDTTTWAGADLMMDPKTSFSFQVGAATGEPNQIKISIDSMGAAALGIGASTAAEVKTRADEITAYDKLKTDKSDADTTVTNANTAKTNADNAATGIGALVTTLDDAIANDDGGVTAALAALSSMAGFVGTRTATDVVDSATDALVGVTDTDNTGADLVTALEGKITALASANTAGQTDAATAVATAVTNITDAAIFSSVAGTKTEAAAANETSVAANALVKAATDAATAVTDAEAIQTTAVADLDAGTDPGAALSTSGLKVDSGDNARLSITAIDASILKVNDQRSELGAVSNRLNHTVNNLTNISSNLSAAKGGIEDADFALETTNLAKNQILQQASTAMLA